MPRPKKPTLSYLHHKPTNLAYVRIPDGNGGRKVVYIGEYNSPESRAEHARILAGMAASPSSHAAATFATEKPTDAMVNDLIVAFMEHAANHYRREDGTQTGEVKQYKQTLRLLRSLYGHTPATEFGPRSLKVLRQAMVGAGWCRKLVNQRVGRVKRVFKWAASEELIPASVYQGLITVTGLQAGRTSVRESEPVAPVLMEHVLAVLPHLRPAVAAMVEVQLLTGMRPGEVCQLRPSDIDRSASVWIYRPNQFKTKHRGKTRVVAIGPRAQTILSRFTPPNLTDYYFSPKRVVEELRVERSASRKTTKYPGHMKRNAAKRVKNPKRIPAEKYRVAAYEHAVGRAVEKANRSRIEAAVELEYHVPRWGPNRLRHNHGTLVRQAYGLEAAQVSLGHARADVTQIYAERNELLAAKVASEIG